MASRPWSKEQSLHFKKGDQVEIKKRPRDPSQKSTVALKNQAIKVFNAWIRERDKGKPCISCGEYTTLQCGHFYSAGHYPALRFNEFNTAGQCLRCNYFLSGDLIRYRENLIQRIGLKEVEKLDLIAKSRSMVKNDRFQYLSIIEKYKL